MEVTAKLRCQDGAIFPSPCVHYRSSQRLTSSDLKICCRHWKNIETYDTVSENNFYLCETAGLSVPHCGM